MTAEKPEAEILSRQEVFNLRAFLKSDKPPDIRVNWLQVKAGKHGGGTQEFGWLMVERGDSVAVLGYDPVRDEVVLINQLRTGVLVRDAEHPYSTGLVAGVLEPGENPLAAGGREAVEEAGITLRDVRFIHKGAYLSTGILSEKMTLLAGITDSARAGGVHGLEEENESIRTVVIPAKEFIRDGRSTEAIPDMKTFAAAQWLRMNRHALRLQYAPDVLAVEKQARAAALEKMKRAPP